MRNLCEHNVPFLCFFYYLIYLKSVRFTVREETLIIGTAVVCFRLFPSISDCLHLLMRCKILLRQLYYRTGQKEYTNQIRNNHQAIKGISNIPQ